MLHFYWELRCIFYQNSHCYYTMWRIKYRKNPPTIPGCNPRYHKIIHFKNIYNLFFYFILWNYHCLIIECLAYNLAINKNALISFTYQYRVILSALHYKFTVETDRNFSKAITSKNVHGQWSSWVYGTEREEPAVPMVWKEKQCNYSNILNRSFLSNLYDFCVLCFPFFLP